MSLHVIFIDSQGQQLSDVTSNFTNVTIPQNAFIMRIVDDTKSYSNSTLTKLFEIDNTFYSKVLEYTTKGDYPFIDVSVQDFSGFTAIFNQLSAQFVGNNPPEDIYDFTGYGGSSGGDIDFSSIVTALNSIASALSALTNLSNLSNLAQLANIITAINNKDNQSEIKNTLLSLFTYSSNGIKLRSIFSGLELNSSAGSSYDNQNHSIQAKLVGIVNSLLASNMSFNGSFNSIPLSSKLFTNLLALNGYQNDSTGQIPNNLSLNITNSVFKQIRDKISNIETKLEQNLPFTTLAQVDVVTDYTQVVKGVGKNE